MVQVSKISTHIDLIKQLCWVVAEKARWRCGEVQSSRWKDIAQGQVLSVSPWCSLPLEVASFQISHPHILSSRGRKKLSSYGIWEEVFHFSFPETPANVSSSLFGPDWFKGPSLNQSQWPEEMGWVIWWPIRTRGKFNPTAKIEEKWFISKE